MENKEIELLKTQIADLQEKLNNQPKAKQYSKEEVVLNPEEETIYIWEAPIRLFTRWDRRKITTVILWSALGFLVLIFLREYTLVVTATLVVATIITMGIVPPKVSEHRITNKGIHSFGVLYTWDDLLSFYFAHKQDAIVMHISTKVLQSPTLFYVIPPQHLQQISDAMAKYVKYYDLKQKQDRFNRITEGAYIPYNDIKNLTTSTFPNNQV